MKDVETPALDALRAAREKLRTQEIGEFLEWCGQAGLVLASYHEHTEACGPEGRHTCGLRDSELFPLYESREKLLARYAGVDLDAAERERAALLRAIRGEREQ
jgi:hypothetical protein